MLGYPFDKHFIDAVDSLSAGRWKYAWDYLLGSEQPFTQLLLELKKAGLEPDEVCRSLNELRRYRLDDLVALAVLDKNEDYEHSPALTVLQLSGAREVFEKAENLCKSLEASKRSIGVQILMCAVGKVFHDESIAIVSSMFDGEVEAIVLESLIYALAHLRVESRSARLKPFVKHLCQEVREAVAYSLAGQSDAVAISALIVLSKDAVVNVRSWATYGLGAMTELNTRAIRDALFARITDDDEEIRLEAIDGLAERHDERILKALCSALQADDLKTFSVEAAKKIGSPVLLPLLLSLQERGYQQELLKEAIVACTHEDKR